MSPTHANKKGVRYQYYVSQALLQNRKAEAGSIARIPAPEIESLVCEGVRRHLAAKGEAPAASADRELIERHVARVSAQAGLWLKPKTPASLTWLPTCHRRPRSSCPGRRQASRP